MLSKGTLINGILSSLLGLSLAAGLACWNPFAPQKTGPIGKELEPPTTPENLLARLDYAMNEREWEEYESLLDDDYWFSEPNELDSLNYEWGKDRDVESVKHIFEEHTTFDFDFVYTRRWTELGVEYPGEGHDAHPDEDWEVFYGRVEMFMLEPNGVDGFRVDQNMSFKLRYNPETKLWYIIRWIDDPLGTTS